jgi:hypothetical protein
VEKASFLWRVGVPIEHLSDIAGASQALCLIASTFVSMCIGQIHGSCSAEARRNQVLSLLTVSATLDVARSSVAFDAMPSFHRQLLSARLHLKPMHLGLLNGHWNLADFRRVECGECGGLRARSLISKVTMALSPQSMWPAHFICELIRHFLFVHW